MKNAFLYVCLTGALAVCAQQSHASSGMEGAAFLDIPVGAGPAALGSAYTALASDAYAPTWNPGGLGWLESTQMAAQHLQYIDTVHYEYLSAVHPIHKGRSIGASLQYLGSGDVPAFDNQAQPQGSFSSRYSAWNLSYGQTMSERISVGLTGKVVQARISDVSATAFAADFGALARPRENLSLGLSVLNLGTRMRFLTDGDPLPLTVRFGFAYQPVLRWTVTAEGAYRRYGPTSGHVGVEWWPLNMIALRAGYRTDTTRLLSASAGVTAGAALQAWGQELAYAWLPYGELGATHYLSLVIRFGEAERARRNLIYFRHVENAHPRYWMGAGRGAPTPAEHAETEQLMELLRMSDTPVAELNQPALPLEPRPVPTASGGTLEPGSYPARTSHVSADGTVVGPGGYQ